MKKGLLKAGVLLLLFAAALGGTAALINREKIVGTRQMEDASLPILYMEVADTKVNPMYGYAGEMEEQLYARQSDTTSDRQKSDDGDRSEECIGKDGELPCIDGRRNGSCGDKQDQQAEEEGRGDQGRISAGNTDPDEPGIHASV